MPFIIQQIWSRFGIFPVDAINDEYIYENNQLDSSAYGSMDEMDDMPQGLYSRYCTVSQNV
jgi:hypothetical protein